MFKRWMLFLLIPVSIVSMVMVSGQDAVPEAAWSAYLFNRWTYELVRVNLDGVQASYPLRAAAGAAVEQVWNLQVNDDGTQAYYCFSSSDSQTGETTTRFIARDVISGTNSFEVDLPCWMSHLLSEDGNRIVVGSNNQEPDRPAWHLTVLDTSSGEIISQLNAGDPALAGFDLPVSLTPMPIRFVGNLVEFAAVPAPSDPPFIGPLYRFDLTTRVVSAILPEISGSATTLRTTGEVIWPSYDPNQPAGKQGIGPMYTTNNVIREALANGARTIFYSSDELIFNTSFINDGRQLAISLLEPLREVGEGVSPEQGIRWVALDRQGSVTPLTEYLAGSSMVANAPGGYLLLHTEYTSANASQVTLVYHTMNGESIEWWSSAGDASDAFGWSLVWSAATAIPADLPIFPAVQPEETRAKDW